MTDEESDEQLAEVATISVSILELEQRLTEARERRAELFRSLRSAVPPVELKVIAKAAGLTDVAITAALRRSGARAGNR